jgi:hypothetical protein
MNPLMSEAIMVAGAIAIFIETIVLWYFNA